MFVRIAHECKEQTNIMPFFKRSAKVPITSCQQNDNDNTETCAIDTYRLRSGDQPLDIANQNRLIEHESNAERLTAGSTSSVISGRVSSFVNGIFGKMGKNRRKNKLNQQPIQQQQQQQQSHLKKVHLQSEKQPQHGKNIQRQPTIKKGQHNEFYSNELSAEHTKSVPLSFDVNIKSEHGLKSSGGDGGGGGGGVVSDDKLQRKLHDTKNNMKNHQNIKNFHSDTFNTNENQRVIGYSSELKPNQIKSATNYIGTTNASDCQTNNRKQPIETVTNDENDKKILCPLNEQVIKNSPFGEETQPLHSSSHSCIEIDSSIVKGNDNDVSKTNSNRNECKQLTPQNNNHISSSADANNNEVRNVVKNIGDEQKPNVVVNCKTTDSKKVDSAEQQPQQQKQQGSVEQLENLSSTVSTNHTQKSDRSRNQQSVPCNNNRAKGARIMGQTQSANTTNKSKQQNNAKSTNYEKTVETKACTDPKAANFCHDAAAAAAPTATAAVTATEAPHYDKNKINFSNEINEILETETSSKQQSDAERKPEPQPRYPYSSSETTAANEIKDVFYETSSELNGEINSGVFVTNGKSVTTHSNTGTVTENVNGSCDVPRFDSVSNETNNIDHKTDTKIPIKNDKIDVTVCDRVEAATATTPTPVTISTSAAPSSENDNSECDCVKNNDVDQKNSISSNEKTQNQCDSASDLKKKSPKLNENCEKSEQMEQNVLYRVDSYNSDDALELSDIEETVIDQHGKVIEVKTLFKQRPAGKLQSNDVQFRKNSTDNKIDGIRTINGRRRSNSITGSLGIEIVEVGLNTNHADYLTQQPFVSYADDTNAIKLSDLCDNTKEAENVTINAIDIVEIVEESSESCSEYEEIEEEIEEEVS